jgi:hypothetical protein
MEAKDCPMPRRRTNRTPKKRSSGDWSAPFLAVLRRSGNVREACKRAKIGRRTAYDRRESDAKFRAAWDDAIEDACDDLELEARRRAKRQSDTLLIFLLKAHRPEKFRERFDLSGKLRTNGSIVVKVLGEGTSMEDL